MTERQHGPLKPTRAPSRRIIALAAEMCVKLYVDLGRLPDAQDKQKLVKLINALDGHESGVNDSQVNDLAIAISNLAAEYTKPES